MPETLSKNQINQAANEAYQSTAEALDIAEKEIHKHQVCITISRAMLKESLIEQNPSMSQVLRVSEAMGDIGVARDHSYLLNTSEDGNETIIDPTWQQFLKPNQISDSLPKVLIGSREEVIEKARVAGVPEKALEYWKEIGTAPSMDSEGFWKPRVKSNLY